MLKHKDKLLNTDCVVVSVGPHTIYPIFRVGSTTLKIAADRKYTNEEITNCDHIDILLRDPGDRFISGLNKYCNQHGVNVHETRQLIEQGKLNDRHFAPQYMWLLHLYKFYKGSVTLRPFEYIKKITDLHWHKDKNEKTNVPLVRSFVEVDYKLISHINETTQLGDLIKEYRHVLS